jgi:3-hydroxy-3-methylglutaryl CoA synthase
MVGITSYGVYIPFNRLPRSEIARVWGDIASGEKAVASPDEDALTMAVAAAIDCTKGVDFKDIGGVYFASTTSPYREKQAAATIAQVLNLKNPVSTMDFSGSLRSDTNVLKSALDAVKSSSAKNVLVCASELRLAYPGGDKEMSFGDGAAAFLIGSNKVIAEIEDSYTRYNELINV